MELEENTKPNTLMEFYKQTFLPKAALADLKAFWLIQKEELELKIEIEEV